MADQTLTCPKCGGKIPLTSALTAEIEARLRAGFDLQLQEREQVWKHDHKAALAAESRRLEKEAADRAARAVSTEMADLRARLEEERQQLEVANKAELELRKRTRALEERERQVDLELARRLDAERKALVEEAGRRAADTLRDKLAEKDLQLAGLRQQVDDMQRRIEQGSQQTQGEISEVQLEAALAEAFPGDDIRPVPKGVRGADVCHHVRDRHARACGVIAWERKNTRNWSGVWVQKLKDDQRELHGDVAVLVSRVLPEGVDHFGWVDGVWVAHPDVVLPLASALRSGLIELAASRRASVGKNEKMELLYGYFTSGEFRQRIQAVVESVVKMRSDLDQERRAMERTWKKRAADIERVVHNFAAIYGDLQSVAGKALPDVPALALPGEVVEDEDAVVS